MKLRVVFVLLSLVLAAACGGEEMADAAMEGDQDFTLSLRFEPDESQQLLPGGSVAVSVRCTDRDGEPVQGVEVSFALIGDALGASLNTLSPKTDRRGMARTSVRAGSEASEFRVRASAEGAEDTFLRIDVGAVKYRSVLVDAVYGGVRYIATRTVTARPNVSCDEALADGMPGVVSKTIPAPLTKVTFKLDPGVRYAVVAWGRDGAGGLLARGCAEISYSVDDEDTDEGDMLDVKLLDHALVLVQPDDGPFQVELELNVSVSSARLGRAARDAALAKLPQTAEADADAFLDAIEAELRVTGNVSAADAVQALRADAMVATSLGEALRTAEVGPSQLVEALNTLLSESAERLVAKASYAVDGANMQFRVDALYGSRAGGLPVLLSEALLASNRVTFVATFDEPSARIDVSTLGLTVDLAAYGVAVLDALQQSNPDGILGILSAQRGCRTLTAWWATQPAIAGLCETGCLQSACDAVGQGLLSAARASVATQSGYGALTMSGFVWVADRNDNNLVDAVGSSELPGTWHGDPAQLLEADLVTGELRMAAPPLAP